jgi:hypothetical protein
MSLVQALEFTVMPCRAVHSDLCVRLENDAIDLGPVELGQLTSQSRWIPSTSRQMSSSRLVWHVRSMCRQMPVSLYIILDAWGRMCWRNFRKRWLVLWSLYRRRRKCGKWEVGDLMQTAKDEKKREISNLRFLMKIFESVEASQSCRPTELCNVIFQVAENSSLLGYYVLANVTKLPAFRRIVKPLSSRESSVNWHINGIILRLRKLRMSRLYSMRLFSTSQSRVEHIIFPRSEAWFAISLKL